MNAAQSRTVLMWGAKCQPLSRVTPRYLTFEAYGMGWSKVDGAIGGGISAPIRE